MCRVHIEHERTGKQTGFHIEAMYVKMTRSCAHLAESKVAQGERKEKKDNIVGLAQFKERERERGMHVLRCWALRWLSYAPGREITNVSCDEQ